MLRNLFGSKAEKTLQQPYIVWQDGAKRTIAKNPFFQQPAKIDLTIPNRSGNRVTRAMRPIVFALAATGTIAYGVNEITKDENGNGFFQNTIDTVVNTTNSVLRLNK